MSIRDCYHYSTSTIHSDAKTGAYYGMYLTPIINNYEVTKALQACEAPSLPALIFLYPVSSCSIGASIGAVTGVVIGVTTKVALFTYTKFFGDKSREMHIV